MNNAEELIFQYEIQRGTVTKLINDRRDLIRECDNISIGTGFHGMDEGTLCLSDCWGVPTENCDDYEYSTYDFKRTLQDHGCEACNKSFAIKRGPLMDAKKKLGGIKRKLANFGKKLIKDSK